MKVADLIAQKLIAVGVERPSARLVDEIEKLIAPRVQSVVENIVTPRLVARAFASTLAPQKGVLGDVRQHSPKQAGTLAGPSSVACQDPTTTTHP